METFKVKHLPGDFIVRESLAVRLVPPEGASHRLLLLRKCGYTTMEVVRVIAGALDVPSASVGYCGLKDEDGITEQLISVPIAAVATDDLPCALDDDRWYETMHYGFGAEPLRVGRLEGNSFKIILRNVPAEHGDGFFARRKHNFMFFNYFDTQRFGVPGGPKRTHLVGGAIIDERWDEARDGLIALGAPESALAAEWTGASRDFFLDLDERVLSFYPAAHASFAWNRALAELAATATGGTNLHDVTIEGIDFRYATETGAVALVLAAAHELPIERYRFEEGGRVLSSSVRTTIAQTTIQIGECEDDECFPGRKQVELSFFLPSGSYATAAIRQLVAQIA